MASTSLKSTRSNSPGPALRYIRGTMEVLWLAAAGLAPLAVAPERFMMGPIEVPKVVLLRSIVALLLVLWAWEWATMGRALPFGPRLSWWARATQWLRNGPSGWIVVAAVAFLAANILSTVLSPMWRVSLWGREPGWDTYSLYSVATYIVLFLAVATHLRRREQLQRLLWVVVGAAVAASAYGIAQHFGFDPLRPAAETQGRVPSFFGNPIPVGSFLVMTIPVTLIVGLSYGQRMRPAAQVFVTAVLVAIQFSAMIFTLSRGPWVGLGVGMLVFLVPAGAVLGRRLLAKAIAIVLMSLGVAAVITLIPASGANASASTSAAVLQRASSIYPEAVEGGISDRLAIWKVSARLVTTWPWVDSERFPELPSLSLRPLRPLVGYGPDMFAYPVQLVDETRLNGKLPYQAHNFLVHEAVELGLLGFGAYVGLLVFMVMAGIVLLAQARRKGYPLFFSIALLGLLSAVAGRIVEQLAGIPVISDLTLFWLLAAILVAFPAIASKGKTTSADAGESAIKSDPQTRVSSKTVQMLLASLLTLAVAALMWQANWKYIPADVTAASAERLSVQGNYTESMRLVDRAISLAPDVSLYRLEKSAILNTQRQETTQPSENERLLWEGYREIQAVLQRNPMHHGARVQAGEYGRQIASFDKGMQGEAIDNSAISAALLPRVWQVQDALAITYLQFGQPQKAAAPLAKALSITGESRDSAQTLYLVGWDFRDLGKPKEAIVALEKSVSLVPTTYAYQMLAELYMSQGDQAKAADARAKAEALGQSR